MCDIQTPSPVCRSLFPPSSPLSCSAFWAFSLNTRAWLKILPEIFTGESQVTQQLPWWLLCVSVRKPIKNPVFLVLWCMWISSYFSSFFIYFTRFCWAASSTGQQSWTLCCFAVWQMTQMGYSSFWQKILSFSLWRKQTSWFLLFFCAL